MTRLICFDGEKIYLCEVKTIFLNFKIILEILYYYLSGIMRKNTGNRAADQRLCFRYIDSTIPLLPKSTVYHGRKALNQTNKQNFLIQHFKTLVIFCGCTVRFVSDLVRNPEDMFSRNADYICKMLFVANKIVAFSSSKNSFSSNMHAQPSSEYNCTCNKLCIQMSHITRKTVFGKSDQV